MTPFDYYGRWLLIIAFVLGPPFFTVLYWVIRWAVIAALKDTSD